MNNKKAGQFFSAALMMIFIIGSAVYALHIGKQLDASLESEIKTELQKQVYVEDQLRILIQQNILIRLVLSSEDAFEQDDIIQEHSELTRQLTERRFALLELPLDTDERRLITDHTNLLRRNYDFHQSLIERARTGNDEHLKNEFASYIQPQQEYLEESILAYRNDMLKKSNRTLDESRRSYQDAWNLTLAGYIATLIISLGVFTWFLTHLRKQQVELHWNATHDSLTGLVNRYEFEHTVTELLNKNHQGILLYLDLDHFKLVNDSCGHAAGDQLLILLSQQLASVLRGSDMIARLGGDEFGVILIDCPIPKAFNIAEKIRAEVSDFHFVWEERQFEVGVSIGMVEITQDDDNYHDILKKADVACYNAKDEGRNSIHLYSTGDVVSTRRLSDTDQANIIRTAIKNDDFVLYQQPIKPLKDGFREYCEVLLRLNHPERGLIHPADFLTVAERHDLLLDIDMLVFRKTVQLMKDNDRTYSINLSGASLSSPRVLDELELLIRNSDIDASKLVIEITESTAIANLSRAVRFMRHLNQLGCRFALDDFGNGLSSFTYLKQMPVSILKIDGSFVTNLEHGSIDYAFVESVRAITRAMGIQVVAEWVETQAVNDLLKELDIDYIQGYLVGKPEPL